MLPRQGSIIHFFKLKTKQNLLELDMVPHAGYGDSSTETEAEGPLCSYPGLHNGTRSN